MTEYQKALGRLASIASNKDALDRVTQQIASLQKEYDEAFSKCTPAQQELLTKNAKELGLTS